jgi:RNA polymerase sigma-70 factor (ECF subfamily)
MAYNKAREERKWLLWKEAEEKKLRGFGVDEDVIQKLRSSDWEDFKSERRYQERKADHDDFFDTLYADESLPSIGSVQDLIDSIENERLLNTLMLVDKKTLQILVWKMEGYTSAEISAKSGISTDAVDMRVVRLRKKIKNIL